jgi:hypothetical protein
MPRAPTPSRCLGKTGGGIVVDSQAHDGTLRAPCVVYLLLHQRAEHLVTESST